LGLEDIVLVFFLEDTIGACQNKEGFVKTTPVLFSID